MIMEENMRIHAAISMATRAHNGQKRKASDLDYIAHPMEVMGILIAMGCNIDLIIAGALHDTVEDTYIELEDIQKEFGENVARLVKSHTEDKSKSWKERKTITINYLADAQLDEKILALADLVANERSMIEDMENLGDEMFNRFKAPKAEIDWYYKGCIDAMEDLEGIDKVKQFFDEAIDNYNIIFR